VAGGSLLGNVILAVATWAAAQHSADLSSHAQNAQTIPRASEVINSPSVPSETSSARIPISGSIKGSLPAGKLIYVVTQGPLDDAGAGRLDAGHLIFYPPCSVDSEKKQYVCDDVQLGDKDKSGQTSTGAYKVYIGLADSAAAHYMGARLYAQATGVAVNQPVSSDPPTSGFDALEPSMTVQRR
jgi:hypothetical protein